MQPPGGSPRPWPTARPWTGCDVGSWLIASWLLSVASSVIEAYASIRRAVLDHRVERRIRPRALSSVSPAQRAPSVGAWRSLVARIVRDDEVGGSNPLAPTSPITRCVSNRCSRAATSPSSHAFSFGCGWAATISGPSTSNRPKISRSASSRSRSGTAGFRQSVPNSDSSWPARRRRSSSGRSSATRFGRSSPRQARLNVSIAISPLLSWRWSRSRALTSSDGSGSAWAPSGIASRPRPGGDPTRQG